MYGPAALWAIGCLSRLPRKVSASLCAAIFATLALCSGELATPDSSYALHCLH